MTEGMNGSDAREYMSKLKKLYISDQNEELLINRLPGARNILNVVHSEHGWTPEWEEAQQIYYELEKKLSPRGKNKLIMKKLGHY